MVNGSVKERRENRALRYLTENDPKKTISKRGIVIRKLTYPILRKLAGPFTGVRGVVVEHAPLPRGPKIFAITHTYSREDVTWGISLAGESAYLVTNAYQELLYTSDGYALWACGTILIDRHNKESRQASVKKAERVLGLGGNVIIFPEGVWNMSPNLLVRKLYPGVYRVARRTGAPVIPISTMMYGNTFYMSRGAPLQLEEYEQQEGIDRLRDELATLKWRIMEKYGHTARDELLCGQTPEEYWHRHLESYIARQEVYEREEEDHAHFMDPADIEYEEVSHHLAYVRPNAKTAFLFSKRWK